MFCSCLHFGEAAKWCRSSLLAVDLNLLSKFHSPTFSQAPQGLNRLMLLLFLHTKYRVVPAHRNRVFENWDWRNWGWFTTHNIFYEKLSSNKKERVGDIATVELLQQRVKYTFWISSQRKVSPPPHNQIYSRIWLFLCWNSQISHLKTGGVSHFTQATTWTGKFRTFIVHGPWTGSKTVRFWLKIE